MRGEAVAWVMSAPCAVVCSWRSVCFLMHSLNHAPCKAVEHRYYELPSLSIAWCTRSIERSGLSSVLYFPSLNRRKPRAYGKSFHVMLKDHLPDLTRDGLLVPVSAPLAPHKLRKEFPGRRVRVVVALSGDKDKKNCLERILKFCGPDRIHFAEVRADSAR